MNFNNSNNYRSGVWSTIIKAWMCIEHTERWRMFQNNCKDFECSGMPGEMEDILDQLEHWKTNGSLQNTPEFTWKHGEIRGMSRIHPRTLLQFPGIMLQ